MNKIYLAIIALLCVCCGEDSALTEVDLKVKDESKEWLKNDSVGFNFIMRDNNGISQSYYMAGESSGFSPSTTSYFWIKTKVTNTESYHQTYNSSIAYSFSILITAGFKPFGDDLSINLGNYSFSYDLKYKTIARLSTPYGYKSKTYTDDGYEADEEILSSVEYIGTITINRFLYQGVLHFKLADFTDKWEKLTITDIYIARHYGLVKYCFNNGVIFQREM